jgi:class 3 adenylate cyclase
MFTDIVDSTKLVEVLGEEKWRRLLTLHDRRLRELIEQAGGEVIKQTGDGYFAAFQTPPVKWR